METMERKKQQEHFNLKKKVKGGKGEGKEKKGKETAKNRGNKRKGKKKEKS